MKRFSVEGKTVTIYPGSAQSRSAVYFNTYGEQGEDVYKILSAAGCTDFSLITVSELEWNRDMSPWEAPAVVKGDEPFTGGADEYLELTLNEIIPRAEAELPEKIMQRAISGYSMAGLFAVYTLYRTDVFDRAASVSGSLWFPGFKEYVFSHETKITPKRVFFSLGDKECRARNRYLRTVQENTEEIERFYLEKGIRTEFMLNPGNHFADAAERAAKGISRVMADK